MRTLLLLLLLCALPLSQAKAQDTIIIAAFGDSLTAGYGVAPEDAFPAQLEKKLLADGYHVNIINDGVSGDTTAGGLSRVDFVLRQHPDIVILELGANDMLRAFPPQEVRKNLDAIVQKLHNGHIKLLIAGQKSPLAYGTSYREAYDPIFCDLAKQYGAECYPFFLDGVYNHPELVQQDGLHPNKDGVAVIVKGIYPKVTKLLSK